MTFAEAIERLDLTINRDDIEVDYINFLNRAVRETANRFSWESMKKTATLNVATGAASAILSSDFKELQNGRFPVKVDGTLVPVYSEDELERLSSVLRPATYLTLTKDSGTWRLNFPAAVASSKILTVRHFAYPAEVTNTALSTQLLLDHENMILSKAAALIFQSINDPAYVSHDTQFEKELEANSGEDIAVRLPQPRPEKT